MRRDGHLGVGPRRLVAADLRSTIETATVPGGSLTAFGRGYSGTTCHRSSGSNLLRQPRSQIVEVGRVAGAVSRPLDHLGQIPALGAVQPSERALDHALAAANLHEAQHLAGVGGVRLPEVLFLAVERGCSLREHDLRLLAVDEP
jgi:hypothetical protein